MPVRKYRSVADMPAVQPGEPLDPENLRVACELSELVFTLHGDRLEPGVRKYRSLEEANRSRQQKEKRRAEERRLRGGGRR
jgi:hypothetical protein